MTRWTARVVVAVIGLALALGCRGRARTIAGEMGAGGEVVAFAPAATTLLVRPAQDGALVEAALTRALEARGHAIESVEAGRVIARLEARRVLVRVAIGHGPDRISIEYLDSSGLEVEDPTRSRRYEGWIRQLAETIEQELARPAREQAEAIARAEQARLDEQQRARDEAERERQARLESERLATERARAEAEAERQRRATLEAEARWVAPRLEGPTVTVVVPGFRFDAEQAQRARGAVSIHASMRDQSFPGTAGGPVRAESLGLPAGCPGFFPTSPQHTIVVRADVPFVRIEAPSAGDATLAIVAPDGSVWCNDDGGGSLSPRIEGWLPVGAYHVFVGNYRGPEPLPYTLTLSRARGAVSAPPGPAIVVAPPLDCRRTLIELGHSSTALMFCEGAEPQCADALLRAGHPPTDLQFCQGVDPACSVPMMRAGRSPTELIHCE